MYNLNGNKGVRKIISEEKSASVIEAEVKS